MEQNNLVPQFRQLAKQLLRISHTLNDIYQDQLDIVGNLTAQNMFKIEQERHRVMLANGLFYIQFYTPEHIKNGEAKQLAQAHFFTPQYHVEALETFFFQDLYFLTGDLKPQHSLFLRDKAQHLRRLLIENVYQWVDGPTRVAAFFSQLSSVQADIIDHLMMKEKLYRRPVMHDFVKFGEAIPMHIIEMMQGIFSLDYIGAEEFLPIQPLMESMDEFCFSASQFMQAETYRIMSLAFEERFNLQELNAHAADMALLYRHATEKSNLLGFARLMNREYWHQDDLLSKKNFLQQDVQVWQKKITKKPMFDCSRAVNWLFKQPAEVADWLSANIQHSSVRVAVTAMSFLDTHHLHPQMVLATLQHFQYASARLFIHSVHHYAIQGEWFEHPNNRSVVLKGTSQKAEDHRIAISPSILYLDEWMQLMRDVVNTDDAMIKKVYLGLSRIMQAYLQHLHKTAGHLPEEALRYIRPQTQQNRDFHNVLQRYQIQLNDFRNLFYLHSGPVRESVFDSYVRDYLPEYVSLHQEVPKSLTWPGLFYQAIEWHDATQKQEIIAKLKKEFGLANWQPLTEEKQILYFNWQFEELKDLDRIIEEAKIFRNCLAASYAQRIIEGEYVAFHMSHPDHAQPMILGCTIREGNILYDQLEYPNNQKAEVEYSNIAIHFIYWLNARTQAV